MTSVSDFGRFATPGLLIMISLADGAKHGYAMQDDIVEMTGERPGPGTLYGAIRRLEEAGLVEGLPEEQRRKPYRLTEAGRRTLQGELARMRSLASAGLRRLATA